MQSDGIHMSSYLAIGNAGQCTHPGIRRRVIGEGFFLSAIFYGMADKTFT